jgi:hypothetical protein
MLQRKLKEGMLASVKSLSKAPSICLCVTCHHKSLSST